MSFLLTKTSLIKKKAHTQRPAQWLFAPVHLKGLFRAASSNAESFLRLVQDMHQAQEAFVYTRE